MKISKIIYNGDKPKIRQEVSIICDKCLEPHTFPKFNSYSDGLQKYGMDLCLKCRREIQYQKAGNSSRKKMKGKRYSEIYSKEDELRIREIQSKSSSGKNNPMYGKTDHTDGLCRWNKNTAGKTYEDLYGDKAMDLRNRISKKSSGKNNPMYGKPSPNGSGNGWSGWYNGWYFRSLHELSYMINVIERFKLKWESAESSEWGISYKLNGMERTYYADFIINGKFMVEIKPKKLHGSLIVRSKKKAAEEFCFKHNLTYKLIDPVKLLTEKDVKDMVDLERIEFTERYKEKYKIWKELN